MAHLNKPETEDPGRGRRGGKTTVNKDGNMVRKTFWMDRDAEGALRAEARRRRMTEAALLRKLTRDYFGIE